jgi:uncharacterized membrane protein SpoIIM required for sporulation
MNCFELSVVVTTVAGGIALGLWLAQWFHLPGLVVGFIGGCVIGGLAWRAFVGWVSRK